VVIYQVEAPMEEEEYRAAVDAAAVALHVLSRASEAACCMLLAPRLLPCAAPGAEMAAASCPA